MISTSCITGTGFMKCMPITALGPLRRGGDAGDRNRRGVGREHRRPAGSAASSSLKSCFFSSSFSVMASTANCAPARIRDVAPRLDAGRAGRRAVVRLQLALRDLLLELRARCLPCPFWTDARIDVDEDDLEAALRATCAMPAPI